LPQIFTNSDNQRLLESLQKHWEVLPFIDLSLANSENKSSFISLQLAFWLAKPITLVEIIETTSQKQMQEEALFCLLKLGCISWTRENLDLLKKHAEDFKWIEIALLCHEKGLTSAFERFFEEVATSLTFKEARVLLHLFEQGIDTAKYPLLLPYFERVKTFSLSFEDRLRLDALHIWTLFLKGDLKAAQEILERYPIELMQHETTPFYFLLGCFLYMTEGKEVAEAHFMGVMEVPYPPTSALLSYYFTGKIDLKKGWITGAFFWEKLQLYRELSLFYRCIKEKKMASFFQKQLTNELKSVQALYPSS
jgi:serine/threonine-protein kinase